MGCGYSKTFVVRDEVQGQDSIAMAVFDKLHLTQSNLNVLYTAFCEMGPETSPLIRTDGFCAYFKLEKNAIAIRMVKSIHTMVEGRLDFCEMVGLLWDFLSRDPRSMGSFAFYLFDKNKNGYLCRKEVTDLVESVHHTTASRHKGVLKLVQDLMDYAVEIDIETFHKYCQKHDEVCLSLLGLQNSLRENILGISFWNSMAKRRHGEQLTANYIRDLFFNVKEQREDLLDAKRLAALNSSSVESSERPRRGSRTHKKHNIPAFFHTDSAAADVNDSSPPLSGDRTGRRKSSSSSIGSARRGSKGAIGKVPKIYIADELDDTDIDMSEDSSPANYRNRRRHTVQPTLAQVDETQSLRRASDFGTAPRRHSTTSSHAMVVGPIGRKRSITGGKNISASNLVTIEKKRKSSLK